MYNAGQQSRLRAFLFVYGTFLYGVKKVYYGVRRGSGELGMSFALTSPVLLISDDLLGGNAA